MRKRLDWRSFVRRLLGPSDIEAELRATVSDLSAKIDQFKVWNVRDKAELAQAYQRAKLAEREVRRIQREVLDSLILVEPPEVEGCVKIRFHTQSEALVFARRLAADLSVDQSVFHVYKCKICPRHPGIGDRFWHVGHRNSRVKQGHVSGEILRRRARREGRTIGQLIPPEMGARLRGSTGKDEGTCDE